MSGQPVPSQLDQVLPRFYVQKAGPYHPFGRIRIAPFGKGGLRILAESGYTIAKKAFLSHARPGSLLGLGFEDGIPDGTTLWLFREKLAQTGLIDKLFDQFDRHLNAKGYIARGGQMVDASIVPAPKQRNTREENEAIQRGETPMAHGTTYLFSRFQTGVRSCRIGDEASVSMRCSRVT